MLSFSLKIMFLYMFCVLLACSTDAKAQDDVVPEEVFNAEKFRAMAHALLERPNMSDRSLKALDGKIPKIAFYPFKEKDLPISLDEAQVYVDGLTQGLINEANGRYVIVGRRELKTIIADITEIGAAFHNGNPLGKLMDEAYSDLLAVGNLALQNGQIVLGYKLVETRTGRIVSSTQKIFKYKKQEEQQVTESLTIQDAAKKAADVLMQDAGLVRKIMMQGMRYQASGIHTQFGGYFMELLSDAIRGEAAKGNRNFNELEISDFVIEEERFKKLKLNDGGIETIVFQENAQEYIVKGTYWVFEHHVEIRVILETGKGKFVSWRGHVLKSEIPDGLDFFPSQGAFRDAGQEIPGPIDLYLSSNKGQNPLFKIGQKMTMVVRIGSDAYLNCYYLQADGKIFRIFPNRYVKSGKLSGGFLQHIPSSTMPFSFKFTPPRGVEVIKCFALDRDVSEEIAIQTEKAAFDLLNVSNERELTKIYRSLPNVALSEASLIVTVQ